MKPADFVLHLRAEPSDVPPVVRLRHALKTLLRSHQLRCTSVEAVGQQIAGAHDPLEKIPCTSGNPVQTRNAARRSPAACFASEAVQAGARKTVRFCKVRRGPDARR